MYFGEIFLHRNKSLFLDLAEIGKNLQHNFDLVGDGLTVTKRYNFVQYLTDSQFLLLLACRGKWKINAHV